MADQSRAIEGDIRKGLRVDLHQRPEETQSCNKFNPITPTISTLTSVGAFRCIIIGLATDEKVAITQFTLYSEGCGIGSVRSVKTLRKTYNSCDFSSIVPQISGCYCQSDITINIAKPSK